MRPVRPSCVLCLEIWEPQLQGTLRACTGIALPLAVVVAVVLEMLKTCHERRTQKFSVVTLFLDTLYNDVIHFVLKWVPH
jgi:hypothetical protein